MDIVKGYKATDKDMKCRDFQFELGVWYKHEGKIAMCESGFHFCEYPSGPWSFYSENGTRIFKIEARGTIIKGEGAGSDLKHVASEIRLVEEIIFAGDYNTGNYNTGYRNTGYRNTGNYNTGDCNTGDCNTGYRNTGDCNTGNYNTGNYNTGNYNTGYRNTGDRNTGNYNTGDYNTGNYNTGYRNTGYRNTGNRNTGNRNTGNGNATNNHSGFLCTKEPPFIIFDEEAKKEEVDFDLIDRLCRKLVEDDEFDITQFLTLPNATEEKIKALHAAHIAGRNKK